MAMGSCRAAARRARMRPDRAPRRCRASSWLGPGSLRLLRMADSARGPSRTAVPRRLPGPFTVRNPGHGSLTTISPLAWPAARGRRCGSGCGRSCLTRSSSPSAAGCACGPVPRGHRRAGGRRWGAPVCDLWRRPGFLRLPASRSAGPAAGLRGRPPGEPAVEAAGRTDIDIAGAQRLIAATVMPATTP